MKSTFLSFTFLALTLGMVPGKANAQTSNGRIQWSAASKLTWDDFQGAPDATSGDMASARFDIDGGCVGDANGKITPRVMFSFSKLKSWKKAAKATPELLQHEQGCFDIGEVYARKLRKELAIYANSHTFSETAKTEAQQIRKRIADEAHDLVNQYENETNNSRNKAKQAAWTAKIATMLQDLPEYASK